MIRREYGDWDATQYYDSDEYFRSYLNVISQEVRIASTGTGPARLGGRRFYSDQNLRENFYSDFTDAAGIGGIVLTKYGQNANSFGEFGQVNYQFNDAFKATLGVREDHETRELVNLNTGFLTGPPIPSFTGSLNPPSTTSNLPSGKFELDYTPAAGTLIYESISRGVKSGRLHRAQHHDRASADPFEPEKLTAYEIGVKSDSPGRCAWTRRCSTTATRISRFWARCSTYASDSYIGRFVNADSRISGGEVEVEWRPLGRACPSRNTPDLPRATTPARC